MKFKYISVFVFIILIKVAYATETEHNYIPPDGYVPNSEVAIKIAIAVWEPIYGKENIERQYPYTATLINDTWLVKGSIPKSKKVIDDKGQEVVILHAGGIAEAEISKTTGQIFRISHGK